jgi:hypothetical protein
VYSCNLTLLPNPQQTLSKLPRPWSTAVQEQLSRREFCASPPGFWGSTQAAYGDIAATVATATAPRLFLQRAPGVRASELDASKYFKDGRWEISLDGLLGGGGKAIVLVEDLISRRIGVGTALASLPAVAIATAWLGGEKASPEFGNKLSVLFSDDVHRHVSISTRH